MSRAEWYSNTTIVHSKLWILSISDTKQIPLQDRAISPFTHTHTRHNYSLHQNNHPSAPEYVAQVKLKKNMFFCHNWVAGEEGNQGAREILMICRNKQLNQNNFVGFTFNVLDFLFLNHCCCSLLNIYWLN